MSQERACPNCHALNHAQQKNCEACGHCMDWALYNRRCNQGFKFPWQSGGLIMLGLALGLGFSYRPGQPPSNNTPPPVISSDSRPEVDVVFVIDTTGSMGDEIQTVKDQVVEMMNKIQGGSPQPFVRVGMVAYRDRGDEYVTKTFPLTSDINGIKENVRQLVANGGGDTPESVNEALHTGIYNMNWSANRNAKKLMFLIGDAPPHTDYPQDFDFRADLAYAKSQGIKLHTWGCSGIVEGYQPYFKEMADITGGEYQLLTYQRQVKGADGREHSVVLQGDSAYEVTDSKADWKVGADRLSSKACKPASRCYEESIKFDHDATTLKNNLDRVLVEQVQCEAKKAGVSLLGLLTFGIHNHNAPAQKLKHCVFWEECNPKHALGAYLTVFGGIVAQNESARNRLVADCARTLWKSSPRARSFIPAYKSDITFEKRSNFLNRATKVVHLRIALSLRWL